MKSAKDRPLLSIVVTGRNDGYGGDFHQRLQNGLHWLASWSDLFNMQVEYVFVNYNPLPESPGLKETIQWPVSKKNLSLRIIDVPFQVHQRYLTENIRKSLPFYEFLAKNIGIRRAAGDYILCTNADVLPDPGIYFRIGLGMLNRRHYYRADRADFSELSKYDFYNPLKTLIAMRQKVFRVFLKGYAYDWEPGTFSILGLYRKRFSNALRIWRDIQLLRFEKLANRLSIPLLYENLAQRYHLHASGDFMLMHRDHWHALRAYPESTWHAVHTDSLLILQAAAMGLKEKILSAPVYHQDHGRRDAHHDKENHDFQVMYKRLVSEGNQMIETKTPILYNSENWGAAQDRLPESRWEGTRWVSLEEEGVLA